ncbi:hypothetical protein J437_LFUL007526 [Ladona fulva]|uniref:PiggyBac transposable element-derived protein domain-containing protein n=1 Tax=Ladona fulva TaxID=123851 RepID=A0A8K0NXD8_LADFU|nr:hypothetical protein J437_LFUL007526 [Ladona fulva]
MHTDERQRARKVPRGYNDYRFESNNEIFIVRWKDNKCVAVATNFDTLEPTVQGMRWCMEKSAKAYVPQPALINNYFKYMGGVDWLLEKHAIAIKGYGKRVQRERSFSFLLTSRATNSDDIRHDGKEHIIEKRDKQRRCQYKSCSSNNTAKYLMSPCA